VPTVHRLGPYRFFFYSNENQGMGEPPHIHVRSAHGTAKFWLDPVRPHERRAYTPREIDRIRRIVEANREILLRRWHDFFDPPDR
jgi:hypothetical protein